MKEIGCRYETNGIVRIVEMTSFEFAAIQEFLAKFPEMESEFDQWKNAFSDEVRLFKLPNMVQNVLIRSAWKANVEPFRSAFSDEDGNLLDFATWRELLLSRPATLRVNARHFPKIAGLPGLGKAGLQQLIEALGETTDGLTHKEA